MVNTENGKGIKQKEGITPLSPIYVRHCGLGQEKWLVDFNAGKNQLISFDHSNNTGVIEVLEKNILLQC